MRFLTMMYISLHLKAVQKNFTVMAIQMGVLKQYVSLLMQYFWYSHRTQMQTHTGQESRECPRKMELIAPVFFELLCKQ